MVKAYSVGDVRKDTLDELTDMVMSEKWIVRIGTQWNKFAQFEEEHPEFRLVPSLTNKLHCLGLRGDWIYCLL